MVKISIRSCNSTIPSIVFKTHSNVSASSFFWLCKFIICSNSFFVFFSSELLSWSESSLWLSQLLSEQWSVGKSRARLLRTSSLFASKSSKIKHNSPGSYWTSFILVVRKREQNSVHVLIADQRTKTPWRFVRFKIPRIVDDLPHPGGPIIIILALNVTPASSYCFSTAFLVEGFAFLMNRSIYWIKSFLFSKNMFLSKNLLLRKGYLRNTSSQRSSSSLLYFIYSKIDCSFLFKISFLYLSTMSSINLFKIENPFGPVFDNL